MFDMVKPDFQKWATGFSGFDGGNLRAATWFCGIEPGGTDDLIFSDVSNPGYLDDKGRERLVKEPYNQKLLKLYSAILGEDTNDFRKVALENKVFDKSSNQFKLNLYPISFRHDGDELWDENIYRKTGLPTKSMYQAWCQCYRFQEIRKWAREHSPQLIIGTGFSYRKEFIMGFEGVESTFRTEKIFEEEPAPATPPRKLIWLPVNDGKTLLIVTPFMGGRNGLNSDALLRDFGRAIRKICETQIGSDNMYRLLREAAT